MMEPRKCPATGMGCTNQCGDYAMCMNLDKGVVQERRINVDTWPTTTRKEFVWTIMWRYSDNSASGVLNVAFRKKEDAEDMWALLDEHSDSKHFTLCQSVLKY